MEEELEKKAHCITEEIAKLRLHEYYALVSKIDKMAVADALEELKSCAENLADSLTDLVYNE